MPRNSSKGIAPQTAKCLLELIGTGRVSSAGWSDCGFLHLLKRGSAFSPTGGKEYVEANPLLISHLLSLPFVKHTSLSAPSPPFPKHICYSLYRCHVAHDITSWGNNILTSVVQLILTLCAHCTLRMLSWINCAITAKISRTITYSIILACIWISFCTHLVGAAFSTGSRRSQLVLIILLITVIMGFLSGLGQKKLVCFYFPLSLI